MMPKKVVDLKNARDGEYAKVIEEIESEGRCPFCKENFKYHKNPILQKNNGWFITENSWPYKNTKHHFVIIGESHKENLSELTLADMEAVMSLARWAVEEYNIPGGGLTIRFGDTTSTGASVVHLHFHLIVPSPDPRKEGSKEVIFSIGG